MNYRDYVEIMEDEALKLPAIGKYELDAAVYCQNVIRALEKEEKFNAQAEVKQMEEKKISHILTAIEWARLAKEMPIEFAWADKQLIKTLKRDGTKL